MEHTKKNHKWKRCVKFHEDGVSFDWKEVLILLLGHLGSAGNSLDLKATCQERTRRLCLPSGPPFTHGRWFLSFTTNLDCESIRLTALVIYCKHDILYLRHHYSCLCWIYMAWFTHDKSVHNLLKFVIHTPVHVWRDSLGDYNNNCKGIPVYHS